MIEEFKISYKSYGSVKDLNDQSKGIILDVSLNENASQEDIDLAAGFVENYVENKKEYDGAEEANTENAPEPLEEVIQASAVDGTTGQNAINQLEEFKLIADISGLIVTKLDGTSRAGIILKFLQILMMKTQYMF